jgi:hypothetical protein
MKLIDKDALVAEIEKIKCKVDDGSSYCNGWQHALRKLEIEINTLEVKEVDFEKESKMWIEENQDTAGFFDLIDYAKYFFELGLKAQKGE